MNLIGVTGHRYLTDIKILEKSIDEVLERIKVTSKSDHITIFSQLAIGSDQLVVKRAIKNISDLKIVAPIPFAVIKYIRDFPTIKYKCQFLSLLWKADDIVVLPKTNSMDEAYFNAGMFILDRCDVLIALWDGNLAQGKGGTGDMVYEARKRMLPIAWICTGNRLEGTNISTSLGDSQGKIIFERFPELDS